MKYLAAFLFACFIIHLTAAGPTESPDDDDDWDDTSASPGSQEADDDGRVYKNPRNSPSALCPRDEEQATLLGQKCLRKCSSDEDCKSKKKKCLCDGACGMSCIKPDRECPELEKPELGDVTVSGRLFGDKAVYSCPHGYHVVGLQSRNCQADGQWAGQPPACKQNIYCLTPPHIEHARHSALPEQATFDLDATIQYHCHTGYVTNGFPRAKCLAIEGQASWYGPDITCEPRSCGPPGELPHGWVTAECHTFGCRAALHCGAGFELVGKAERFCQPDGSWAPNELPTCVLVTAVQCPTPDAPRHGRAVFTSCAYNSIVSYECKYGYRLVGDNTRRCGADKKWSGQQPVCKEINCGHPGRLYNGWLENIEAGTGLGASIIFRCHDGMRMEGNSSTVCLLDGSWRYPLPKCLAPCVVPHVTQGSVILVPSNATQEGNETIPSAAPTTQIIGSSTMVHHGEALIVLCEKNYEFLSNNPAVTCNNGTWTQIPKCQPARCKRLPKPPKNGMVVAPKTEHGMRARFHCKDGFALRGPELLLCSFGNWTGEMPICQEVYCPFPGYIEHGKVLLVGNMGLYDYRPYVRKVVNNKQIMYDCDKGYVLAEGPPGATCIGGQWSPKELPNCVPGQHPRLRWSRRRRSIEINKARLRRSIYLRKYYHDLRKRAAQIAHHEDLMRHLNLQELNEQIIRRSSTQNIGLNKFNKLRVKRSSIDVNHGWDKSERSSLLNEYKNMVTHVRRKREANTELNNENQINEWSNFNRLYRRIRKRSAAFRRPYFNNARRNRGYHFFGLRPRARRDVRNRVHRIQIDPTMYKRQVDDINYLNDRFQKSVLNEMNDIYTAERDSKKMIKSHVSKRDVNRVTHFYMVKKIDEMKKQWEEDSAKKSEMGEKTGNFHLNSQLKIDPKPDKKILKMPAAAGADTTDKRVKPVVNRGKFKDLPRISTEDMIKRMKRTSRKTEKLNQTTASVPKSNKQDKLRQPPSPVPQEPTDDLRSSAGPPEGVTSGGGRRGGGRVKGPCEPITSEPYVNVEIVKFGREPNVTYSSGTIVRVACGKGYDLNLGYNSTAKCVRGRWKPMKPLCEILPCHIPVTDNGIFSLADTEDGLVDSGVLLNDTSDVLNGQVVQFTCEPGYNVQGASNLRCWHGDWAVTSMPECIPAPCELPVVQHAVYSAGYRAGLTTAHGSAVSIHCERGYSPPAVLQCTLGDIRMRPPEPCQSIEGNISNIREGQDFRGGSDIVREDFDELEYPTSSSSGTDCGPPARVQGTLIYRDGSPSSGTSHQRYPHGTEVTFRCIAAIMGEKSTWKIVCDSGKWMGKSVSCEEEDMIPAGLLGNATCTFRNNEPNVVSFYNDLEIKEEVVEFPAGSILISRCTDIGKYAMIGPNQRRCMGGEWDGSKPSCFGLNQENDYAMEKPPTILFRHQLGPIAQSNDGRLIVYPGTILHMECLWMRKFGNPKWNVSHEYRKYPEGWSSDPGRDSGLEYRLSIFHATQDDSGIFTCITPARQSHQVDIVVEAVHCPPLPMRRGLISSSQSTKLSSEVSFSCANGNSLIGAARLVCLPSGNWSAPLPLCESVECGEVPIPSTTAHNSRPRVSIVSRGVGGRAAFSCAPGWGLRGPSETVCSPSGEWVPPPPSCIEVSCPAPQPPANGYLLGKAPFRAGDVVQFNCNPAHMMQGQPIVACQDNARWSGETPKCIQACSYPGTTISGRMSSVKFYYKIGETISFTCESGLILRGTPMLRCLRNGKWSNAIPICSRDAIGNETFIGGNDSNQLAMLNDDPLAYFNSSESVPDLTAEPAIKTMEKYKKINEIKPVTAQIEDNMTSIVSFDVGTTKATKFTPQFNADSNKYIVGTTVRGPHTIAYDDSTFNGRNDRGYNRNTLSTLQTGFDVKITAVKGSPIELAKRESEHGHREILSSRYGFNDNLDVSTVANNDDLKKIETFQKSHILANVQAKRTAPTFASSMYDRKTLRTDPTKIDRVSFISEKAPIYNFKSEDKRSTVKGPPAPVEQSPAVNEETVDGRAHAATSSKIIVTRSSIKKDLSSMFKASPARVTAVDESPVEIARKKLLDTLNNGRKIKNR